MYPILWLTLSYSNVYHQGTLSVLTAAGSDELRLITKSIKHQPDTVQPIVTLVHSIQFSSTQLTSIQLNSIYTGHLSCGTGLMRTEAEISAETEDGDDESVVVSRYSPTSDDKDINPEPVNDMVPGSKRHGNQTSWYRRQQKKKKEAQELKDANNEGVDRFIKVQ